MAFILKVTLKATNISLTYLTGLELPELKEEEEEEEELPNQDKFPK
jgi:hypothetical protein